jgi:hypothetical protein
VVFVLVPFHAQRCPFCLHAGLLRCLDDRAPRRHIHSIPLHYILLLKLFKPIVPLLMICLLLAKVILRLQAFKGLNNVGRELVTAVCNCNLRTREEPL